MPSKVLNGTFCRVGRPTSALLQSTAGLENKRWFFKKKHFRFFLYEDRTRKYDPKAHEKHPIHGMPKDKSPVSEGEEHHVKNEDEIDESQKQGWI